MTRRNLSFWIGITFISLLSIFGEDRMIDAAGNQWAFIGNYSMAPTPEMAENHLGTAQGIYVTDYDATVGELGGNLRLAYEMDSPNFLALSPNNAILYAISGTEIYSFNIDAKTGNLTLLNKVKTPGAQGYCHVAVSPDGRFLGAADYPAGLFDFYQLRPDGSIGETSGRFDHFGSGPDEKRQKSPFGHSVYFVEGGDGILHALLVDLGSDRVSIVDIDPTDGTITQNSALPELKVPAGHGSRHLAWTRNDDGSFDLFVNNELTSTVTFFRVRFDKGAESVTDFGTFSTLPKEFEGKVSWDQTVVDANPHFTLMNSTAESAYRAGRKGNPPTVYVSNRGHDSIAVFQVVKEGDGETLRPIQFQPTFGSAPRFFTFDETGDHLLACNKRSGSIVSFHVDDDGKLAPTHFPAVRTPWPVALVFVPKGN